MAIFYFYNFLEGSSSLLLSIYNLGHEKEAVVLRMSGMAYAHTTGFIAPKIRLDV